MSETASQASWDDFSDSRCTSPALSVTFDDNPWEDDISSPESRPPTSFESEPPPPPVSPPTFTSSIWTRFGNGLSRLTQEIIKVPAVPADQTTDQGSSKQILTPRDDVVDGAEGDAKKESIEVIHSNSRWNLPESFRTFKPVNAPTKVETTGVGHWSSSNPSAHTPNKHQVMLDDKSIKQNSVADNKVMSVASYSMANIASNVSVLSLSSDSTVGNSLVEESSSTAFCETTNRSPSKSPLRRSSSEASIHDNLSLINESAHCDAATSPSSVSRVTAKPPLPRHRRSPSATIAMEGAGKKVVDTKSCLPVQSAANRDEREIVNAELSNTFLAEASKGNSSNGSSTSGGKARKSLQLASGNNEIFV